MEAHREPHVDDVVIASAQVPSRLAPAAPIVLGSTAVGAGIGMALGGPPGALVGAGIGWVTQRYHIAGGPWGHLWHEMKRSYKKLSGQTP